MIEKIKNGDVGQVSGGQINDVLRLQGGHRVLGIKVKKKSVIPPEKHFIVTDGGKILTPLLTAEEAQEAEGLLLGDRADPDHYKALTGKIVPFETVN